MSTPTNSLRQTAPPHLVQLSEMAARWWREQVTSSARPGKYDNGDDGGLGGLLASMLAKTAPPVTDQALDTFEQLLRAAILAELSQDPEPKSLRVWRIGTDYHPEPILAEAAAAAGIDDSHFPWKTLQRIEWDAKPQKCRVVTKRGYGGPFITLGSSTSTPAFIYPSGTPVTLTSRRFDNEPRTVEVLSLIPGTSCYRVDFFSRDPHEVAYATESELGPYDEALARRERQEWEDSQPQWNN